MSVFSINEVGFEVGNVYSKQTSSKKTYYMAINKKTLITYINGRFGRFTTRKEGHATESSLSVAELCDCWDIDLDDFNIKMWEYFHPDDDAMMRARKEKYEEL